MLYWLTFDFPCFQVDVVVGVEVTVVVGVEVTVVEEEVIAPTVEAETAITRGVVVEAETTITWRVVVEAINQVMRHMDINLHSTVVETMETMPEVTKVVMEAVTKVETNVDMMGMSTIEVATDIEGETKDEGGVVGNNIYFRIFNYLCHNKQELIMLLCAIVICSSELFYSKHLTMIITLVCLCCHYQC